jgi:hypothetical protein
MQISLLQLISECRTPQFVHKPMGLGVRVLDFVRSIFLVLLICFESDSAFLILVCGKFISFCVSFPVAFKSPVDLHRYYGANPVHVLSTPMIDSHNQIMVQIKEFFSH